MDLKKALFVSFVGHCFLFLPLGNLWIFTSKQHITNNVQITYLRISPPKIEVKGGVVADEIEEKVSVKTEAPPPKLEKPKKIHRPARKPAKPAKSLGVKPLEEAQKRPAPPPPRQHIIPSTISGTTLPNTEEGASYYQYTKDTILRFLRKNYKREYEEGIVSVRFVINSFGDLTSFDIIEEKSIKDLILREVCYKSIKSASPFKPFPKGLNLKEYTFNFAIVFKHE